MRLGSRTGLNLQKPFNPTLFLHFFKTCAKTQVFLFYDQFLAKTGFTAFKRIFAVKKSNKIFKKTLFSLGRFGHNRSFFI